MMQYRSQRVAHGYFVVALLLFVLQVLVGLWLAFNYAFTVPQGMVNVFPFATARAMHTNLLVLWMLLGFMGGTYYIVPEETKSEIYSAEARLVPAGRCWSPRAWWRWSAFCSAGRRDGRSWRYRPPSTSSWSSARSSSCSTSG